jgi:hypothetical protein
LGSPVIDKCVAHLSVFVFITASTTHSDHLHFPTSEHPYCIKKKCSRSFLTFATDNSELFLWINVNFFK